MIPKTIAIGYQGEVNARFVDLDISDMMAKWPDAVPSIVHKRRGDKEAYPVNTERNGNTLRWYFSSVDAAVRGFGEAQVIMATTDGSIVSKSKVIETVVNRSIEAGEDVPEPFAPWLNQAAVIKAEIEVAAFDSFESAEKARQSLQELKDGIKSGDFNGKDGFSPSAKLQTDVDGITVTITDKDGTTSGKVTNGKDGYTPVKGKDYFDGKDGKTPVKGTDYWTASDKAEIVRDVEAGIDLSAYAKESEIANVKNTLNQLETEVDKSLRVDNNDTETVRLVEEKDLEGYIKGIASATNIGGVKSLNGFGVNASGGALCTSYSPPEIVAGYANDNTFVAYATMRNFFKTTSKWRHDLTSDEKSVACQTFGAVYDGEWETLFDGDTEAIERLDITLQHDYSAFYVDSSILPNNSKQGVIGLLYRRDGVQHYIAACLYGLATTQMWNRYYTFFNGDTWINTAANHDGGSNYNLALTYTIRSNGTDVARAGDVLSYGQWNSLPWGAGSHITIKGKRA